jgi:hypothetical protein
VVGFDAGRFQAEAVGERDRSDGEQRMGTRTTRPSSQTTVDPVSVRFDRLGPGADHQLHATLDEVLFEDCGHLGIAVGQDLLSGHDQGHLRPECLEDVDELDAGDTRSDHDQVLGEFGQVVGVTGGQDALAVHFRPLRDPGFGSGGDESVVELHFLFCTLGIDDGAECGPVKRPNPAMN